MNLPTFVGWAISLFLGAAVLTWTYNRSRASVLVVALWHGSLDVVYLSPAVQGNVAMVYSVLMMIWGVPVIALGGLRSRQGG